MIGYCKFLPASYTSTERTADVRNDSADSTETT